MRQSGLVKLSANKFTEKKYDDAEDNKVKGDDDDDDEEKEEVSNFCVVFGNGC